MARVKFFAEFSIDALVSDIVAHDLNSSFFAQRRLRRQAENLIQPDRSQVIVLLCLRMLCFGIFLDWVGCWRRVR